MAFRTRLPISDILHRGLVWSLLGVSVWGVVMIGVVHRNTLQAGRGAYTPLGALAKQEALGVPPVQANEEEKKEIALVEEAAQAVVRARAARSSSS